MKRIADRTAVHGLAALFVAVAVTMTQIWIAGPRHPALDELTYLRVADDILRYDVFSDGNLTPLEDRDATGKPAPGMLFGPGYPAFLVFLSSIDAELRANTACYLDLQRDDCAVAFGPAIYVQAVLAALSAFLVWLLGTVLLRRPAYGWLAMAVAVAPGEYAYYARHLLTENLTFPLFSLFLLLGVLAWERRAPALWAAAGVVLGLAALNRPSFAYLFYAAVPVVVWATVRRPEGGWRVAGAVALTLVAGYVAAVAPWHLRNVTQFDTNAISSGYAAFVLVPRLAYNLMSFHEWLASFVYWLPDFGDNLAAAWFDQATIDRLTFDHPTSFYMVGIGELRTETLAAAGGKEAHLGYVLRHHLLADLPWHVVVTLALAWRGLWIVKYWSFVTVGCFVVAAVRAVRRRWTTFLLFAGPAWFMLGLHAFTTVNVHRYNMILIPCLSVATAWILGDAMNALRKRLARP